MGQPIKIYFLNLTEYNSLENLTFKVESNVNGITHTDYWEYTPQTAETINITIMAYDLNGNLLNKGSTTIEVKSKSQQDSLSVLVIGDSTIGANAETQALLNIANTNSYDLTLLGTRGSGLNRHEGRGGWTAGTYVKTEMASSITNPFYNPDVTSFDFDYYMISQGYTDVDCVVIQLGINDIFSATTDEQLNTKVNNYFKNMEHIINDIHSYDANIKVVWNMILPGSTDQSKFEAAYGTTQTADRYKRNTYLANLEIIKKVEAMNNVFIAHTNLSLDTTNNMASGGGGGVHPATAGYTEIGQTLYGVIRAIN